MVAVGPRPQSETRRCQGQPGGVSAAQSSGGITRQLALAAYLVDVDVYWDELPVGGLDRRKVKSRCRGRLLRSRLNQIVGLLSPQSSEPQAVSTLLTARRQPAGTAMWMGIQWRPGSEGEQVCGCWRLSWPASVLVAAAAESGNDGRSALTQVRQPPSVPFRPHQTNQARSRSLCRVP